MSIFKKFVQSDIYLILMTALGFLIWYFQPDISISASIVFVVANFLLFTQKDSNGLLYLFLVMAVSNVAGNNVNLGSFETILTQSNILLTILLIFVLLIELLIFFVIRIKKENKTSLWIGFALLAVSFAISGVRQDGMVYESFRFIDTFMMVLVILLFLLFAFTIDKNSKRYICKCLLYLGVYVSIQIFTFYIVLSIKYPHLLYELRPNLVWGNGNAAALVILLSFPAGAYLYTTKPNFYYFFMTRIAFIGVLASTSRGGILCGILAVLLTDIYARIKMEDHHKYNLVYFGSLALISVVLVVAFDELKPFVEFIVERFLSDGDLNDYSSGRIDLYKQAIQLFLENPIIGIGTALAVVYNVTPWYHSTLFDTLAATGIVGTVMMGVHMFQKYRVLVKNRKDPFVVFVYIGFICSGLYGMIDVAYYNLIWLMIFAIVLASVEAQTKVETLTGLNK